MSSLCLAFFLIVQICGAVASSDIQVFVHVVSDDSTSDDFSQLPYISPSLYYLRVSKQNTRLQVKISKDPSFFKLIAYEVWVLPG